MLYVAMVTVLPLMKSGSISVHAIKAYRWSGGIALPILNLYIRWKRVFNVANQPLYTRREDIRYPLDRRMGWPQSLSDRLGEKRRLLRVPGFEPRYVQPVA